MNRRSFLSIIGTGAAGVAAEPLVKKSYFFFGGLWRPRFEPGYAVIGGSVRGDVISELWTKAGVWRRVGLGPWKFESNLYWHGEFPFVQLKIDMGNQQTVDLSTLPGPPLTAALPTQGTVGGALGPNADGNMGRRALG